MKLTLCNSPTEEEQSRAKASGSGKTVMKLAMLVATALMLVAAAPGAADPSSAASNAAGCDKTCTREYMPVCGSDGRRYANQCLLKVAQCEDPTITQAGDDEC